MKYLNKIGINAKNAFNKFNNIKHSKIIKVLNDFNTMIKKKSEPYNQRKFKRCEEC